MSLNSNYKTRVPWSFKHSQKMFSREPSLWESFYQTAHDAFEVSPLLVLATLLIAALFATWIRCAPLCSIRVLHSTLPSDHPHVCDWNVEDQIAEKDVYQLCLLVHRIRYSSCNCKLMCVSVFLALSGHHMLMTWISLQQHFIQAARLSTRLLHMAYRWGLAQVYCRRLSAARRAPCKVWACVHAQPVWKLGDPDKRRGRSAQDDVQ